MIMRPDLKPLEEARGRALLLIRYALLLLVLRGLAGRGLWHIVPIESHSRPWSVLIASGVVGGVAMLTCRHGISLLSPSAAEAEKNEYFQRGTVVFWLAVFWAGGFVEAVWMALCIVALQQNGYGLVQVTLYPPFCFGFAHLSGLPSRITAGMVSIGAETLAGLMLGAIFIWSSNVITPYLCSVIYFTSSFLLIRRKRSSEVGVLPQS